MVYAQVNKLFAKEIPLPHHFDVACGVYGAYDSGQEVRLTSYEEVASGKFDLLINKNLFIGSVEFMTEVFNRVGIEIKSMPFAQKADLSVLIEAKVRIENGEKIFVKPLQNKLFTGMVFDKMCSSILDTFDDDTPVYISKPFDKKIISEWRCYVKYNKIIDSKNYAGDFKIIPDYNFVEKYLGEKLDGNLEFNKLENYPCCFTIDIGILEDGKNVVIEYNDMWAIGNYGMDNDIYYRMLKERYFEIIRNGFN